MKKIKLSPLKSKRKAKKRGSTLTGDLQAGVERKEHGCYLRQRWLSGNVTFGTLAEAPMQRASWQGGHLGRGLVSKEL